MRVYFGLLTIPLGNKLSSRSCIGLLALSFRFNEYSVK